MTEGEVGTSSSGIQKEGAGETGRGGEGVTCCGLKLRCCNRAVPAVLLHHAAAPVADVLL